MARILVGANCYPEALDEENKNIKQIKFSEMQLLIYIFLTKNKKSPFFHVCFNFAMSEANFLLVLIFRVVSS